MSNRSYVHSGKAPAPLLADSAVHALAATFKVLGDTTRVRILDALARTELCVQDLADVLGLTQSAVSHQLRLLRSMRLVRTRRAGRQIFYALDDDHIVKLFKQGLEHVEERAGAPAATPSRGHGNPRRGVSVSSRRGRGPGASERKEGAH
jgi:DNA-binding transcriptional ArsR family regulator